MDSLNGQFHSLAPARRLGWWRDAADPHRTAATALKRIITGSIEQKRCSSADYKRPNKYSRMGSSNNSSTSCLRRLPILLRLRWLAGRISAPVGSVTIGSITIVSVTIGAAAISFTIASAAIVSAAIVIDGVAAVIIAGAADISRGAACYDIAAGSATARETRWATARQTR